MSETIFSASSQETTGAQHYSGTVEAAVLDVTDGGDAYQKQEEYNFAQAALAAATGREAADRNEIVSAEEELRYDYKLLAKAMSDPQKSGGVIGIIKRQITMARARVSSGLAKLRNDTSKIAEIEQVTAPARGQPEIFFTTSD